MSQLFNSDDNKHSVWGFSSHGSSKYAINTKIMIAAVVVLFIVVLFILVLHIYARWFWRTARLGSRGRSWSRRLRRRRMRFDFVTAESAATNNITNKGLDKAVMEALPVFFYTKKGKMDGAEVDSDEQPADEDDVLECAVCLSEFEENEAGRRLPKCNHVFHTECIDMWFSSHSTCPLCRASVVMAPSEGDPLQLENGALVQDSRSQGERILHETVVSGLLGSSSHHHHANGNAMAIQILQDEGAVLLTGHQQDHYIVNISSEPTSNGSSSSSSRQQQQQQFPANVLFWGNQAYMSSHNLTTTHSEQQQDKVTSSSNSNSGSSNRKLNSFKQQHLVIEVPRRSSGNFSSACSSQYPSPTTTEGGQKSPLGAHLRNIRRLLSRDSRRSSVDASPVGDCCEQQQQLNSACNTPGSVSGCQTPTSQH